MLAGLCSFLNAIGVNLFSCLFLFLDDVYIPYLVDPSSIFKASNCITLTSDSIITSPLTLTLLPPLFTCDDVSPTWIIQGILASQCP